MPETTAEIAFIAVDVLASVLGSREGGMEELLSTMRNVLQTMLTDRFGPLPEDVRQRIAATASLDRLHHALLKVWDMKSVHDLAL
jgi:hypothetical protein